MSVASISLRFHSLCFLDWVLYVKGRANSTDFVLAMTSIGRLNVTLFDAIAGALSRECPRPLAHN